MRARLVVCIVLALAARSEAQLTTMGVGRTPPPVGGSNCIVQEAGAGKILLEGTSDCIALE